MAHKWHDSDKLAIDGPTGIVGSGESIGAVTQMLRGALPFIPDDLHLFSQCGTMFPLIFSLQDTRLNDTRWIGSLLKIAR